MDALIILTKYLFLIKQYLNVPCLDTLSCVCKRLNTFLSNEGEKYYLEFVEECAPAKKDRDLISLWEYNDDMYSQIKRTARDFYYNVTSRTEYKYLIDDNISFVWTGSSKFINSMGESDEFDHSLEMTRVKNSKLVQRMKRDVGALVKTDYIDLHTDMEVNEAFGNVEKIRDGPCPYDPEDSDIIEALEKKKGITFTDVNYEMALAHCFRYHLIGYCRINDQDDKYFGVCTWCGKNILALPLYRSSNDIVCCPTCCENRWIGTEAFILYLAKKRKHIEESYECEECEEEVCIHPLELDEDDEKMIKWTNSHLSYIRHGLDDDLCTYPKKQRLIDIVDIINE